ncbi:hypothetical protein V2J09_002257 [Rumex salicifolius]
MHTNNTTAKQMGPNLMVGPTNHETVENLLSNLNLERHFELDRVRLSPQDDDGASWCFAISFAGRMIGYIALLGVIMVIISLILKWLGECSESVGVREEENETTPLLIPNKTVTYTYGSCHQLPDLESGGSCCSTSSTSSSSSDDQKICVICYDQERDCFLVPCGHSATCQNCALRIFYEENRMCPVCRRFIGKIRKLLT